jgi:protein tyrosine phosphatase (PTP) superfamily phosphohydrolase (DUF442 family)
MMRIAILSLALVVTIGCQAPRPRQTGPAPGAIVAPGAPVPIAQGMAPVPGGPVPAGAFAVPPGGPTPYPTVPSNPGFAPPAGGPTPFPTSPPPVPTPGAPGASGKIESNWQPAEARSNPFEGRVLLAPPEPITGDAAKDAKKQLYPPQIDAGASAAPKLPATAQPVGIPQFAYVNPKVAAGLRPAESDGLDWLQANKYRAVLFLRLPGEKDEVDRKLAEKRELKYVSIEVSPSLLTKETVDEFIKLVRDPQQQPLFVYDRDGALAGGLWYLWFRLVEEAPDDVARIRARTLGLREDRDGAHRDMWQSTQKYLNESK